MSIVHILKYKATPSIPLPHALLKKVPFFLEIPKFIHKLEVLKEREKQVNGGKRAITKKSVPNCNAKAGPSLAPVSPQYDTWC